MTIKKVIIRTRGQDLTAAMIAFGNICVNSFIYNKEKNTYGEDWDSCAYGNNDETLGGWAQLNLKSGTLSVLVTDREAKNDAT